VAKKKVRFDSCRQMRRFFVTHSLVSMTTGEREETGTEWITEPCGAPLFNDKEKETGLCRSCADGWRHEHNYPVEPLLCGAV
jgi:hypothetical protein